VVRRQVAETSTQVLYWGDELRIVWGELRDGLHDEAAAAANIDAQEKIRDKIGVRQTRAVIDMRRVRAISREAREYYANERTASIQQATALLVGSKLTQVIANFFMGLNKPVSPTRMFTNPDEALAWLATFPDE
jgi:hypothetical protein